MTETNVLADMDFTLEGIFSSLVALFAYRSTLSTAERIRAGTDSSIFTITGSETQRARRSALAGKAFDKSP
jgi:hypothetical protein